MLEAFLERDASFDGVFLTAVRTTGIFCRPTCPARKPRPENVEFFPDARHALLAGYRPCRRCRPLRPTGTPPAWLRPLLDAVEEDPSRRWNDADLRGRGLSPERVRRWFSQHHGMTFHAYSRARRLGEALGSIRGGEDVTRAAFASGYDSLSAFNQAFKEVVGATPTEARHATRITVTRIPTPLGPMVAAATDEALCLLEFADRRMLETQLRRLGERLNAVFVPGSGPILARAAEQVRVYFEGARREFDVPLALPGTAFQETVWEALRRVPYGETVSYGELARRLGRPSAVRAVARANGDNRVALMVPCHRVVGSDGALTGYGGGLWRKRAMLALERGERSGSGATRA
ncbi:MAG: methylated-DNA--[protein]-cysteine S-methyltransferase [Gemmatimonadetes bacterium]|nr:methylated-DNA--[protein]-cysteine S-methyltransferase [Gemmatimonadota bacterium]